MSSSRRIGTTASATMPSVAVRTRRSRVTRGSAWISRVVNGLPESRTNPPAPCPGRMVWPRQSSRAPGPKRIVIGPASPSRRATAAKSLAHRSRAPATTRSRTVSRSSDRFRSSASRARISASRRRLSASSRSVALRRASAARPAKRLSASASSCRNGGVVCPRRFTTMTPISSSRSSSGSAITCLMPSATAQGMASGRDG